MRDSRVLRLSRFPHIFSIWVYLTPRRPRPQHDVVEPAQRPVASGEMIYSVLIALSFFLLAARVSAQSPVWGQCGGVGW